MEKNRLEAFSDGVLAIIITIMVLELKVPSGADITVLKPLLPVFLTYALSFVYLGIYWNNHHHLLKAVRKVNGAMMWANLHLLFWLSLFPFVTGWMGENHFLPVPTALYGAVLFLAAIAYFILQKYHHRRAGLRFQAGGGHRPRFQRQAVSHSLRHRNSALILPAVDGWLPLRVRRPALAGSRPPHRAPAG